MKQVIIKDKTFEFAVQIVELYKRLQDTKKEYVLSKQLLRSGTSIGANTREALNAESKADFIHKLAIAQKECDETIYWLELLKASNYISSSDFDVYNSKATEILKILRSIILTTKQKLITHNS
jgi:four helix bundle protein